MGRPPRRCWVCLRKTGARLLSNQVHTLSEDSWHFLCIWQCSPIHVASQQRPHLLLQNVSQQHGMRRL